MNVLLGVCGGVAAYKAAELTRELQRRGAGVDVAMTAGAERFVTALTFASLSGRQVLTSLWSPTTSESTQHETGDFDIEHIRVAQQADVVVIAPATANLIAKLAHGLCDDLLTTICLATKAPLVIAPAMNVNMWTHPATRENISLLRSRGVHIVEPSDGLLACGMVGAGRLAEPAAIAEVVCALASSRNDLAGESIVITAGGTREPIDPVRYLSNRSSGKMGFALAEAALARGATVTLVNAATSPNLACREIRVNTASEMHEQVLGLLPHATMVIMAAAVADYRVQQPAAHKLKKQTGMTLELVRNEDILCDVVRRRCAGTLVVGFAAETENLLAEGRRKLQDKGVDAIVANDVSESGSGFEVDRNAGVLLMHDAEIVLPLSSKREMADRIFDGLRALRTAAVSAGKGEDRVSRLSMR